MSSVQHRISAGVLVVSWFAVSCGVSGQPPSAASAPAVAAARVEPSNAPAVVCLATVDASVRMYRLHEVARANGQGREWRLTMTEPASKRPPLVLALPGAAPAVLAQNVRLSYRSGNGGVLVTLDSSGGAASLDVYVNYELEVNIDATLAPEVDRLNTNGTIRLPPCRVDGS